jgi:beta-phosphoglucomutase-like phosphatase (HAD superfamily)
MLRGIVFDMDGVIIDSHPAHKRAWKRFLCTLGCDVSDRKLDFILEGRKRQDILRHFLGELSESELFDYGKRKDEFFERMVDEVPTVAGVIEFLGEVKVCRMPAGVATSASGRRTRLTLERLGLADHFQVVITGDDVCEGKPNPAIYQMAVQRLGLPAEDLLAVEDAPRGVEAAIGAGMRCMGVAKGLKVDALRAAGADYVIPDFVDISLRGLEEILAEKECSA